MIVTICVFIKFLGPKGPAVLKILQHRSNSQFVEIYCEISPRKQGVSETLP